MKQMPPERLSALLSEESESISEVVVVVDCGAVFTEDDFWDAYVNAVKPQGAEMFGRNMDALWDALEGGGPGSPTQSRVVFANTVALTSLRGGEFLTVLKEIALDCTRMEVIVS